MPDKKIFKKNINKTLIELEIQTKDFAKLINPFLLRDIKDSSKARIYNELLLLINDYSIDCVDIFKWTYTDKVESKKHRKQLLNKKKKIIQSLDILRPKEAIKVSAHIYIKVCRFSPNILIEFVNLIWNKLNDIYENLEQNPKYILKSDSRRQKAVELFIENEILDYYKLFSYFNKRCARMMTRDIPNLGLQYLIDDIRSISEDEAKLINKDKENDQSIWVPIPEELLDKWVDELYIGDKSAIKQ